MKAKCDKTQQALVPCQWQCTRQPRKDGARSPTRAHDSRLIDPHSTKAFKRAPFSFLDHSVLLQTVVHRSGKELRVPRFVAAASSNLVPAGWGSLPAHPAEYKDLPVNVPIVALRRRTAEQINPARHGRSQLLSQHHRTGGIVRFRPVWTMEYSLVSENYWMEIQPSDKASVCHTQGPGFDP